MVRFVGLDWVDWRRFREEFLFVYLYHTTTTVLRVSTCSIDELVCCHQMYRCNCMYSVLYARASSACACAWSISAYLSLCVTSHQRRIRSFTQTLRYAVRRYPVLQLASCMDDLPSLTPWLLPAPTSAEPLGTTHSRHWSLDSG